MRAGFIIVATGLLMWVVVLNALRDGDTGGLAADSTDSERSSETAPGVTAGSGEIDATPTAEVTTETPAPEGNFYTVVAGDTLNKIAQRHHVSLSDLLAANPEITDPTRIEIGQQIRIPD